MKIEPRGKYAGVKIHLDEIEIGHLFEYDQAYLLGDFHTGLNKFGHKLVTKIRELMVEHPDLLKERTPEQIKAELEEEAAKAAAKLKAIADGKEWKGLKV